MRPTTVDFVLLRGLFAHPHPPHRRNIAQRWELPFPLDSSLPQLEDKTPSQLTLFSDVWAYHRAVGPPTVCFCCSRESALETTVKEMEISSLNPSTQP